MKINIFFLYNIKKNICNNRYNNRTHFCVLSFILQNNLYWLIFVFNVCLFSVLKTLYMICHNLIIVFKKTSQLFIAMTTHYLWFIDINYSSFVKILLNERCLNTVSLHILLFFWILRFKTIDNNLCNRILSI